MSQKIVTMSKSMSGLLKRIPRAQNVRKRFKHSKIITYEGFIKQVESECNRYCYIPRVPQQKVTVVGAGSRVGRIVSLLLKQPNVIKTLCLYDSVPEHRVIGVATDLSHIDTSTEVEAYQGRRYLQKALEGAEVVVLCGGTGLSPPCYNKVEDIFYTNMSAVRTAALACAEFCPHAFVAVAVPPVDCNFALVAHVLRNAATLNTRRTLGVNSIASMRATSLLCSLTGADPRKSVVPVVCGCCQKTIVPVFPGGIPQGQVDCMVRLVQDADEIICKVKADGGLAHLSIGYSIARCVYCIMTGLFEKPTFIDSALVWQDKPEMSYGLQVCSSTVTVGPPGIVEFGIPLLCGREKKMLERSVGDLEYHLSLGKQHAVGDETRKRCPPPVGRLAIDGMRED